jgi:hypothetical protein
MCVKGCPLDEPGPTLVPSPFSLADGRPSPGRSKLAEHLGILVSGPVWPGLRTRSRSVSSVVQRPGRIRTRGAVVTARLAGPGCTGDDQEGEDSRRDRCSPPASKHADGSGPSREASSDCRLSSLRKCHLVPNCRGPDTYGGSSLRGGALRRHLHIEASWRRWWSHTGLLLSPGQECGRCRLAGENNGRAAPKRERGIRSTEMRGICQKTAGRGDAGCGRWWCSLA